MDTNESRDSERTGPVTRATVDVRTLVIALALAAALTIAYVVGAGQGGSPLRAAAAEDAPDPADHPTIVMTGTGTAKAVSDEMTFHVTIHENASDVSSALSQANASASQVLHALRGQGVDPTYVKTTALSVQPQYDHSGNGPAVITGYHASEGLNVSVRDLEKAGSAISAAAEAGGNAVRISGVRLGVSDKDAALAEARKAAIDEAMAKAKEYADAAGRDLGDVVSVREVSPNSYLPPYPQAYDTAMRGVAEMAATPAAPIRAGRSSNSVTVAVVWTFAD